MRRWERKLAWQTSTSFLLEKALRERLIPDVYQHTKIAFAALRNDAGMLGALYHLQQQMIQAGRSVR